MPSAPALGVPALAGDVGQVRLAVDDPVELERRVAAEHEPVEGADDVRERPGHGLRLEPREQQHELRRAAAAPSPATAASSSTCEGMVTGSMPDGAQRGQPGRGGRGEVEPHASSFASLVAARLSSTDGRDAGPRGRTRRYQHRARRHQCRAARRPRRVRRATRSPASGCSRASPTTTSRGSGAPTRCAVLDAEPAPAPARLGGGLRRPRPGRSRPGGADFGHIELGAPARAEAPGARRRARPHGAASSATSRSRRCPGPDGRHRMAHPRAPARRRRRAGRPVRGALAPGHRGRRPAARDRRACARSPR